MTITQQPSLLNFSGNLPDILIKDLTADVEMTLKDASGTLLIEKYSRFAGKVKIRLRDVIHSLLSVQIPVYEDVVFIQSLGYNSYTVTLKSGADTENLSFPVIKGFLQREPFDVELFVKQNWLTFQPRQKLVEFHDPEWLTCFPLEAATVKIEATFADQTTEVITYASLVADKLQSVNVQPGQMIGKFTQDPVSYKVWVEVSGQIRQYKQEYFIFKASNQFHDDVFTFENRLGGLDSIRFSGQKKFDHSTDFENAVFDEYTIDYAAMPGLSVEKNTGFFKSENERRFALDFFRSINKYHILGGRAAQITVSRPNLENIPGELANYSFTFQYSDYKDAYPEYGTAGQNIIFISN